MPCYLRLELKLIVMRFNLLSFVFCLGLLFLDPAFAQINDVGPPATVGSDEPVFIEMEVGDDDDEIQEVQIPSTDSSGKESDGDKVFSVVEQMPEFPGGQQAMLKFIYEKIKYPMQARDAGIEGTVYVQFVVDERGIVTEPTIMRGPHALLNEEALRVSRLMPQWKPGYEKGNAVKVNYVLPIRFKLAGEPKVEKSSLEKALEVEMPEVEKNQMAKKEVVEDSSLLLIPDDIKEKPVEGEIFIIVENMPEFPGGEKEMLNFLATNIKYPEDARKQGVEGLVILDFVVRPDGNITDINIRRSVQISLDEEAVRVVGTMPKWIPGKQRGKPVSVRYTLPVRYKL